MRNEAQKCPVCEGSGKMENPYATTVTGSMRCTCNGCMGKGWVIVAQPDEIIGKPIHDENR